jgi:hypothetical protein
MSAVAVAARSGAAARRSLVLSVVMC